MVDEVKAGTSQEEFTAEITDYIGAFIRAAFGHQHNESIINSKARTCAELITSLARGVNFEPWPERTPEEMTAIREEMSIAQCLLGMCSCGGASECKFPRCENCDSPMKDGKTLQTPERVNAHPDTDYCPICEAPFSVR